MSNPRLLPAIPHTPKPAISGEILYIDARSKQNRAEFTAREYYTPRLLIRSPPTVVSLSSENGVRRSLRFFVLYYPRQECPTIYNRFEPKAEKFFSVISRPWGAGSKASTEPGSTPMMGGSEYFTSRFQTMAFIFHCK